MEEGGAGGSGWQPLRKDAFIQQRLTDCYVVRIIDRKHADCYAPDDT